VQLEGFFTDFDQQRIRDRVERRRKREAVEKAERIEAARRKAADAASRFKSVEAQARGRRQVSKRLLAQIEEARANMLEAVETLESVLG
jgi:hypothetical protein